LFTLISEIMPTTILSNQINIPPTNGPIIYPRDIHHRLAQIAHLPLTYVHAPAGYGKTTLIAHWCKQQTLPVAWITLDAHNQQSFIFVRYVYAALQHTSLIKSQHTVDSEQYTKDDIDTLVTMLNAIDVEYVLVIDNLHELQSPQSWNVIQALCNNLPHTTHVVLIGRCTAPFSLTDAYLKGHVNHITKQDLTFTHEDITTYVSHVEYHGYTAAEIAEQSEGWAMAVRLLAQNHVSPLQNNEQHKLWRQFFSTIVDQHPAEMRQVIAISVVFSRFNAQLLRVLLPDLDADACIAYLYAHQLFVESYGDTNEWHRYHRLFAMTLSTPLNHITQEIHLNGATWFVQQGLYEDALVIYERYQCYEQILHIMEHQARMYLQQGEFDQFLASMAIIPFALLNEYPNVALAYAWALIMRGEYEQCHRILCALETHSIRTSDDYVVVETICQFYRTGIVNRTMFQQPAFTRLYAQYPFLHGLAALFADEIVMDTNPSTLRQPIAALYSSTRMLLRQGEFGRIHLYCQESLHNPLRHPLLAALYGIWAEAAYALNLNAQANQLATEAHSLAQALGNHHIRLVSAALCVYTLHMVDQTHEAQQLWDVTYSEALQQPMIPLGRVYILKELWRYALMNQRLDDCQRIQQQIQPNLHLLDIPADVVAQLHLLQAYTAWRLSQQMGVDVLQIARDALEHQWRATFVAAMRLLHQMAIPIPAQLTQVYAQINPTIHMPGVLRDWEGILNHVPHQSSSHPEVRQILTQREYEVFVLAAEGHTNNEIALRLSISLSTVKTHLIHIYEKLQIKRRTDLVHLATHLRSQP
jgi:ATP/maltotriose-dependent transcriptional regulator MalT